MTRTYGHSGLTPSEALIMDLWDAGLSKQAIRRQLKMPSVDRVVDCYHAAHEQRADNSSIAAGSIALRDAIARARLSHQPTGEQNG